MEYSHQQIRIIALNSYSPNIDTSSISVIFSPHQPKSGATKNSYHSRTTPSHASTLPDNLYTAGGSSISMIVICVLPSDRGIAARVSPGIPFTTRVAAFRIDMRLFNETRRVFEYLTKVVDEKIRHMRGELSYSFPRMNVLLEAKTHEPEGEMAKELGRVKCSILRARVPVFALVETMVVTENTIRVSPSSHKLQLFGPESVQDDPPRMEGIYIIEHCRGDKDVRCRVPDQPGLNDIVVSQIS
ncbi:hypothetical protein BC826DRAFT_1061810 [Russula brevipes]|nr:hypothetical protein BC826DRAFT_1061810 [Russula brevipes]